MSDIATTVETPIPGASLLDKKMKKSPAWITGVIMLVALVGGLAYVGFHIGQDLGNVTLGSVWPYLLLATALLYRPGLSSLSMASTTPPTPWPL